MPRLDDLARRRDTQRFFLDTLTAPAQHSSFAGIDEPREPALEFLVDHVTQHRNPKRTQISASWLGYLNLASIFPKGEPPSGINPGARGGSRQLRNHLDLHEEARVHQALHLHPRGRGQALLVVELEAYIRGLQESVHIRRKNSLLDDFFEVSAVCGERALYVRVRGSHLPRHVAGRHQAPILIGGHRPRYVQRLVDQHSLGKTEVLLVAVEMEHLFDARRRRLGLVFTLAAPEPQDEDPSHHSYVSPDHAASTTGALRTRLEYAMHATF